MNLSFASPGLHLIILETEKMLRQKILDVRRHVISTQQIKDPRETN